MARIQLRDTNIFIQDGLSGTAAINEPSTVPVATDTSFDIDTVVLNTDITDLVPVGGRFTVAGETITTTVHTVTARTPSGAGPTTNIIFTPALGPGTYADSGVVTFQPQRITIKIGEGDLTWTEAREMIYDLDRDVLDTVRQGADIPLEVDLNFTFEFVSTESGQAITPVDALKRIGEASEWVSSSSDLCEPYAVDIFVVYCVPCGTEQDEDYTFPVFRYETLDYSIQDASIAVAGKCNVTDAVVQRLTSLDC